MATSTVILEGTGHPEFQYTYAISGTVVEADEGKAVSLDATAANTIKLAAADDVILGRLFKYEDRVVEGTKLGTVETKGGMRFAKQDATVIAVGDTIIGEGAGLVKAAAAANSSNHVVEVQTSYVIVMFN